MTEKVWHGRTYEQYLDALRNIEDNLTLPDLNEYFNCRLCGDKTLKAYQKVTGSDCPECVADLKYDKVLKSPCLQTATELKKADSIPFNQGLVKKIIDDPDQKTEQEKTEELEDLVVANERS